jgi:hypothetical protein
MNGIDELRRTLGERATGVVDDAAGERAGAVRHRVGIARRRRRGGAVAAAAAVLAVVGGLTLLPDGGESDPQPATEIAGVPVPAEKLALGFGYRYSEGVEGSDGVVSLMLDPSDEPRLVSWATSGPDPRVRVTSPLEGDEVVSDSEDFADYAYLPAGAPAFVRVEARSGEPGLAVYTLGEERPDGVTQGGVTYRDTVASQRLLAAAVGEPGESELTVPATASSRAVSFYYFCSGGPARGTVEVHLGDDGPVASGGCSDDVPVDGVEGRAATFPTERGEDVTMRLVVRDAEGQVVQDPDVRVGLGIYREPADSPILDGIPDVVERIGHRWELYDVTQLAPRQELFVRAPRGHGRMLAVIRYDVRDATLDLGSDGSTRTEVPSGAVTDIVSPGERTGYRVVEGQVTGEDRIQVTFYVRAE